MARQDIANMLTGMGGAGNRPNPNMSSSDWRMAFGAQQAQGLMNAAGTTTPQEAIQMGIGKLDLESVKGLQTLAQMQQIRGDMAGAAQTVSQIKAMQQKEEDEDKAKAAATIEEARYQEKLALEERKVAADELKAKTGAKSKIYEPKVNVDKDGRITVISTDPATIGTVLSRASTITQAEADAEEETVRQERENISQKLIIKRSVLGGQAADIRLALEEANDKSTLPTAMGFALQKANPAYATTIGKQTYQKLVDAVAGVQSAQALNSLAELKAQSSTGASGLGATNAMEFSALQSNIRKLNPDVPSTIEAGLQAIERNFDNLIRIDQGLDPIIDWDDPNYAHMVKEKTDGTRAYSYDGKKWYTITEPTE